MNNLPFEILQKIFLHLHQQDKVECMTVCRTWKRAIEESVLLHSVYLYNTQQFNNFVSKCQQESELSKKIGRLIIDIVDIVDIDGTGIDLLPFMTHNVCELFFNMYVAYVESSSKEAISAHPWSETIRKINEKIDYNLTIDILRGGMCPNLTEIKVYGSGFNPVEVFIELLGNAPSLKSLSLTLFELSLEDLELLHKTTPLLSSLSINSIGIDNVTLPIEIQPATRLTSLKLLYITLQSFQAYINFHNYLAMKYPKIVTLEYDVSALGFNFDDLEPDLASQLMPLSPLLTSLNLPYTNKIQLFLPTLEQYNCRLKKICLNSAREADEIITFVQSKQAQHIQSLSLTSISSDKGVNYLRDLPALTELNLNCDYYSVQEEKVAININKLLENIGSKLATLRISQAKIVFDPSFSRQYSNLKNLELQKNFVPKKIDYFISQSFPKLQSLILYNNSWTESTLYLGDLNLAYLELRQKFPSANPRVLVVTTSNNRKRCYTARSVPENQITFINNAEIYSERLDPTTFPAVKSFPYDPSGSPPCTTIVCNSVYDFFLVNHPDSP